MCRSAGPGTLCQGATFVRADASSVQFDAALFNAVLSFYALIHLPLEDQPPLLDRIASWLRPGGLFVATTGYWAWTGVQEDWLGGGAPMWWSQRTPGTYRSWITQAGLTVEQEEFVPEGDSGHALFLGPQAQLAGRLPRRETEPFNKYF